MTSPQAGEERPRRRKRLPRWEEPVQRVQLITGTLIAILGLPGAGYGVYRLVHSEPVPVHLDVEVAKNPRHNRPWKLDHGVLAARPGAKVDPNSVGYVYTVHVVVRGLSGKNASLSWTEEDPNGSPLQVPRWVPRSMQVHAGSNDYETDEHVWVPVPSKGDAWVVVFTLAGGSTTKTSPSEPEYRFESGS
jgi:hypothetical protein